jgi:small subunit ribosomal protein S3Ae
MAKARSRAAARKVKDKWKAKSWYNILAPSSFDNVTVSETLSDEPNKLMNRISEVSLQDITNDFRKSHIKLFFKIYEIEGNNAHTQYIGHTLTSDYLRRMIRRKRSKIDGVYDVTTRDGAKVRVKPFATTDRRIQNSQRRIIRETMKKTIADQAKSLTLSEFIKSMIDGKTGSEIYKSCKKLYPVKRIEIYKTEVISQPTIVIEEPKKPQPTEEPEEKPKEKKKTTAKKPTKESKEEPTESVDEESEDSESEEEPKKETESEPEEEKESVEKEVAEEKEVEKEEEKEPEEPEEPEESESEGEDKEAKDAEKKEK